MSHVLYYTTNIIICQLLVHPPRIEQGSSDFQSVAMTTSAKGADILLNLVPQPGLEPGRLSAVDFESTVSTIPPSGHCLGGWEESRTPKAVSNSAVFKTVFVTNRFAHPFIYYIKTHYATL